ncbi:RNA polymerase recycling motor HelD [Paenibacillus marinisediminis]
MSDSINELERQEEEARLHKVIRVMDHQMHTLRETIGSQQSEIVEMKRNFWDEVTVDSDAMFETYVSVMQQAKDLANYERVQEHASRLLNRLQKHIDNPYFGRIRFREEGDTEDLDIYIGLMSVTDAGRDDHLVYDWRTPIASLFYDYAPGPARYRTPMGQIEGEMTMKRQYVIRDGALEAVFDTGIQIGDDMLQDMLTKSADTKMKSIVSTIQREQNRIIRDEQHDVLFVQGAAGSGKTSAALQRIAYLLYKYRDSMRSEQVLLFSPNELFNDYVSNILPELGEANMTQTTYQDYLDYRLPTSMKIEDVYDQAERLMAGSANAFASEEERDQAEAQAEAARWKSSSAFMKVVDAYVEHLHKQGMAFLPLGTPKRTIITTEMMREYFYVTLADWSLPARVSKLKDWIMAYLDQWAAEEEKKVYRRFLKQKEYWGTEQEMKEMSRKQVRKWVRAMQKEVRAKAHIHWDAVYAGLVHNLPLWVEAANIPNDTPEQLTFARIWGSSFENLKDGNLTYEDASAYLYLLESVEGFDTFNHIRHVVIDEAQDYSPFQYALLSRLFPRSKFTILGDWNQAIYEANRMNSVASVQAMFADRSSEVIRLTKSYRSTRNITEYAQHILPEGEPAEPFNREGNEPRLTIVDDEEARIQFVRARLLQLKEAGIHSAAVITKDEVTCNRVYAELEAELPELRRVTKHTRQFVAGYWVMPSYLAKGLEFDAVIVYDADAASYGEEKDRKLLYTVCTRALHELDIVAVGEPSPWLK